MTFGSRLGNAQTSLALRSACRRFLIVGIKRGILFFTEVIGRVYHVKPIVGLPCFFQCYIDFVFLLLARESSSKLGSPLARASVHLTDKIFLALCILAFTHVRSYTCAASQQLLRHNSLILLLLQKSITFSNSFGERQAFFAYYTLRHHSQLLTFNFQLLTISPSSAGEILGTPPRLPSR